MCYKHKHCVTESSILLNEEMCIYETSNSQLTSFESLFFFHLCPNNDIGIGLHCFLNFERPIIVLDGNVNNANTIK